MHEVSTTGVNPHARGGVLGWFRPPPPAPPLPLSEQEVRRLHQYWQWRIIISSLVGYAGFYFVRKNIGIAMPAMEAELGIGKASLGLFLTLHGLIYGVSKFANGYLGDRANAPVFMAAGLVMCALANFWFGLGSTALIFGLAWLANGWFQGMGFPPCARVLNHWIPPRELATKMSIWNSSHSVGAALAVVVCGYLASHFGWRWCFLAPAGIAILFAVWILLTLKDTPQSLGLPEVEGTHSAAPSTENSKEFARYIRRAVFQNPYIWIFALANFFVYIVRYAILDWGPTLLSEYKGIHLSHAGWMVAGFEITGILGMIATGWITDKWFGGKAARTCLLCMVLAGVSFLLFWKMPSSLSALSVVAFCLAGFFIYGPQALVGIAVAKLATKNAAATAIGLTGIFGYASTVLSGWGLGWLVQTAGWQAGFIGILIAALLGSILFAAAWPAKADGYQDKPTPT